jgi:sugar phosphate isomerase/epimerase
MQIAAVEKMAQIASRLDCSLIRIFTGFTHSSLTPSAAWKRCVEAIRECAERTGKYGVRVGVQNHHDIAVEAESYYDFITEVKHPFCVAMFDAWSAAIHGTDLAKSAEKLAPLMAQTTVADYKQRQRFRYRPELTNYESDTAELIAVPMGEGFIDYDKFFQGCRNGGFQGWVTYEMCSPLVGGGSIENLDRCARRFLDFMSRV